MQGRSALVRGAWCMGAAAEQQHKLAAAVLCIFSSNPMRPFQRYRSRHARSHLLAVPVPRDLAGSQVGGQRAALAVLGDLADEGTKCRSKLDRCMAYPLEGCMPCRLHYRAYSACMHEPPCHACANRHAPAQLLRTKIVKSLFSEAPRKETAGKEGKYLHAFVEALHQPCMQACCAHTARHVLASRHACQSRQAAPPPPTDVWVLAALQQARLPLEVLVQAGCGVAGGLHSKCDGVVWLGFQAECKQNDQHCT